MSSSSSSSGGGIISRVGGYAPGWLADYATVGSALHKNYSALGPFSTGDVTVGVTYLWEAERKRRAEAGLSSSTTSSSEEGDRVIGSPPSFDDLDDLRALCVATEAAYYGEREDLRKAVGRLGHEILYSVHKSQFQMPAHYISLCRETGDVHFVVRGTQSLADALTDGDAVPEPLNSALPEMMVASSAADGVGRPAGAAAAAAHRGMARAARWLVKENVTMLRELLNSGGGGGGGGGGGDGEPPPPPPRRLTVLGHSLGAGSAAIAAILLREHFPTLRCVAFATPPCLDLASCGACAPYLTSVVLHDDVIPRASLQNVEELRCRLQSIPWRDMAAADFARTRAGQAAAAANVSLTTLGSHTSDAVKSFTGKDEYTFGDITATLVSRGAGKMASAIIAARRAGGGGGAAEATTTTGGDGDESMGKREGGAGQDGVGGGGGGGGGGGEGTTGKTGARVAAAAGAAAGAAGAAAAAVTKRFAGLTSSFTVKSKKSSDGDDAAPASAGEANDDVANGNPSSSSSSAAAAAAVAVAKQPGMYHRIFAKEKEKNPVGAGTPDANAVEEEEEETPFFFVPGKVYHLRRGPLGAGSSVAHVAADSPTLCRIELSSSLIADHSLGEYREALDTLAIRPTSPHLPSSPRVEVSGTLEWEEAGGLQYNVGMGKWTSYEGCYILAHETCLKRPNRDGELIPIKLELWGNNNDFTAERHDFKGKGSGIKITDPGKKNIIRLYLPSGDEEELSKWLAAIQRCCKGLMGDTAPPPFAATPVAVF